MEFDPGFPITAESEPMRFVYGVGVYGPEPEIRSLGQIRPSLMEPDCTGPEDVYCIAMDVAREADREDLNARNLLYGVVTYQKGQLGREPIRSQGHIHAVSASCGASTCEVYEIWDGTACIYMQESGSDDAGRCYAVYGGAGDVIIVPPGWVHATINASPDAAMTFGAWCVRDYGFDYTDVRRHKGIAFFPLLEAGKLVWVRNENYRSGELIEKRARAYPDFRLESGKPIYVQYEEDPARFDFVTNPLAYPMLWENYVP
ncbi:MAG: glucose-6-phosphate isomerase family protein [Hominenteromicrobium sp.]